MADLFDRLFPEVEGGEAKISIHSFAAAFLDYAAGETTRAQIIAYWNLDTEAQSDLNAICDTIDGIGTTLDKIVFMLELDAVMLMAERGAKYTTKSEFKTRLGLT